MIADILAEVAEFDDSSPWVHIGGDEVKYPCWNSSSSIREHVKAVYGDLSDASFGRLQAEWTANVSAAAVVKSGKIPVLWQPTTKGPGDPVWDNALPKDSVYMVWLNSASAKAYAQAKRDVVYTTPFYVANMGSGGWTRVYNADIMPSGLTPEEESHVIGAEVCAWGESLDEGNLAMRSFQIGAGAAESFWRAHNTTAGPGSATGLPTSDRFNRFLCTLQAVGVHAPPVMPSHCETSE